MSTSVLSNLRDYLYGTLSPANMLWLSKQLADYVQKQREQERLKPYTMEEINAMLDEAERQFAAGEYVTNEDLFREWDEEIERAEHLELAEAV
ncbi:MAG: hypothetical protein VZQ51_01210 [Bacteroidales bacterium]|nr:hypothetical protein [Bacteroidales bacterium]MEE3447208.1 hypothetical protein [Bacteroidales bacterium]